jgi:hypothetical protein
MVRKYFLARTSYTAMCFTSVSERTILSSSRPPKGCAREYALAFAWLFFDHRQLVRKLDLLLKQIMQTNHESR